MGWWWSSYAPAEPMRERIIALSKWFSIAVQIVPAIRFRLCTEHVGILHGNLLKINNNS
jgi:hypothetical protein